MNLNSSKIGGYMKLEIGYHVNETNDNDQFWAERKMVEAGLMLIEKSFVAMDDSTIISFLNMVTKRVEDLKHDYKVA